ncbi:MAG TPA: hypothetical protein VEB59_07880 [Gemmatimonadales bacterium]|nr:hypothetical protein [Gemmatimonadales bacterium]
MTLAERPDLPAAGAGRRVSCLLLLLVLLAAGVTAALLLRRARLRFTNRLAAPVQVVLGGGEPRRVAPGETVTLKVPKGGTLVAEWSMVRPLSADGQPMGEAIAGSLVLRGPTGTIADSADTVDGETNYFAPLITNATDGPLRVKVNAGLGGAVDCGCAVRAGGRRVFIGYYRLYGNSTVEARGPRGTATFRDLGPRVTSRDGTVGLRYETRDLRPRRRDAGATVR